MAPMLSTFGSAASRNYGLQLPSDAEPSDADWADVAFLMKGQIARDGDDNITIDDESSSNHTVSTSGSPSQGSISPFRPDGYSTYFGGTTDYQSLPADAGNVYTAAFTIDIWVKPSTIATQSSVDPTIILWNSSSHVLRLDPTGNTVDLLTHGGADFLTGTTALKINAWTHIAICRDTSNNLSLYVNGNRDDTASDSSSIGGSGNTVIIGTYTGSAGSFVGMMSNLRTVKGTDVYGATNSSITVPTAPLTAITNTEILICGANRFIDESTNDFTVSVVGDSVKVAHESPFGGAVAWDPATHAGSYDISSNNYLSASASSDFDVAGGSFTIECWMYDEGHGSSNLSFFEYGAGGSWANVDYILYTNATTLSYDRFDGSSGNILQQGTIGLNEWHHVAVAFDGTNTSLFIDGTRAATDTTGQNLAGGTPVLYFGNGWDGTGWSGLLSGMRIVKGTDVYGATNSSITVPTAPFTAITNTKLLLNGTNAPIVDAKASVNLQMTGDTQSDTAITKFALVSALQDGTADNITPVAPLDAKMLIGVADFCIEGWFYFDSVAATPRMVDFRPLSTNGLYPGIRLNGAKVSYWNDSAEKIVGTTTVTTGAWHHIAVSRSGTSTKMWLAGSQEGSTYTDSSAYLVGANRPILGGAGHTITSNIMDGNYEEIRITIGAARYTTGFTPPTAVFPPPGS